MRKLLGVAALFAVICSPAVADEKYDRSIDEAAARILADKVGEIRGTFGPGEEPVFVTVRRAELTGSAMGAAHDLPEGLVKARDSRSAVSVSF